MNHTCLFLLAQAGPFYISYFINSVLFLLNATRYRSSLDWKSLVYDADGSYRRRLNIVCITLFHAVLAQRIRIKCINMTQRRPMPVIKYPGGMQYCYWRRSLGGARHDAAAGARCVR